ncbi:ABC transporter substrate-binding protein [Halocella sp. SP3-1]|uniref:ABC transporter substrate-binding protein n=1 Tax=Halocella sp. SP3-1 TaxID=2382161 RepID=UPI000F75A155|nr:ABC transporter substrate-binding protein [Halocella sp. SP3-1]AZO95778.1 extracellular solute-binding protein [Halocella sp. SP3-1]
MKKTRNWTSAFAVVILIISFIITSPSLAQVEKDQVAGSFTLYTSQPDADVEALVEGYNKKYPKVRVNIFRSGTEEVISKLMIENKAGKIQADVLLVADNVTFERLAKEGILYSYKSPESSAIPAQFVDPEGMYTGTKIISTIVVVNTKHVSKIPDSWKILISNDAENNAMMPSPLYSGAAAYNLGVLTRQSKFTWDFYKALNNNGIRVGKGNGSVIKAVASGEKDYGMVIDYMVARAKKQGSPVDLIYPKEGVPAITEPIGIIKSSDNKTLAKTFVDFVLSEEGQKLAVEMGYTPIRSGLQAPTGLKTIDEIKFLEADTQELLKSRESDKKKFSYIFNQ